MIPPPRPRNPESAPPARPMPHTISRTAMTGYRRSPVSPAERTGTALPFLPPEQTVPEPFSGRVRWGKA